MVGLFVPLYGIVSANEDLLQRDYFVAHHGPAGQRAAVPLRTETRPA